MPNKQVEWKNWRVGWRVNTFFLSLCLFLSVCYPTCTFSTLLVYLAPKSRGDHFGKRTVWSLTLFSCSPSITFVISVRFISVICWHTWLVVEGQNFLRSSFLADCYTLERSLDVVCSWFENQIDQQVALVGHLKVSWFQNPFVVFVSTKKPTKYF